MIGPAARESSGYGFPRGKGAFIVLVKYDRVRH
jgi:hypothetical protein